MSGNFSRFIKPLTKLGKTVVQLTDSMSSFKVLASKEILKRSIKFCFFEKFFGQQVSSTENILV